MLSIEKLVDLILKLQTPLSALFFLVLNGADWQISERVRIYCTVQYFFEHLNSNQRQCELSQPLKGLGMAFK